MPGGNDLLLDVLRLGIGEHDRVVGQRIEFDVEHAGGLRERITHGTVHLRNAPQRIAVCGWCFLPPRNGRKRW